LGAGRAEKVPAADIERVVRRWFVMSMLTQRYSGNPESSFDFDIRQIESRGLDAYTSAVVDAELSEGYWTTLLPQQIETSSGNSPYFLVFQAAQVKMGDKGFLSRDITVRDLILNRSDVHHLFPRDYLKKQGMSRGRYNQIANYALAQSEINIAIGNKPPSVYFRELAEQCGGGPRKYGGIIDIEELKSNLREHCVPAAILVDPREDYNLFLEERRALMAAKVKRYFGML
jgi:hypothetical protein